jgi:peroxidase
MSSNQFHCKQHNGKGTIPNQKLKGFDIINKINSEVEIVCLNIVLCDDIIALATKDIVF